jgi:hypothetical protein
VKKIPEHADFDEENEEYKYNASKCDAVKEQLAKIREHLEELYDDVEDAEEEEEADNEHVNDLSTANDGPPLHEDHLEEPINTTPNDLSQVATVNDEEEIIIHVRSYKILEKYFYVDPGSIKETQWNDDTPRYEIDFNPNKKGLPRPLPGIVMRPNSNICESSSTKHYQKCIYDCAMSYKRKQSGPTPPIPSALVKQKYAKPMQQPQAYQQRPQSQQYPPQYHQQPRPQLPPPQRQSQQYPQQQYYQQAPPQQYYQNPPQQQYYQNAPPQNISYQDQIFEKVVSNEQVQQRVGQQVGEWAGDEKIQSRVGDNMSKMASNKQYQSFIGDSIAKSSDNALVGSIAKNEQVQSVVGTTISNTVGNKQVQQAVGGAVKRVATDREMQKKIGNGVLKVGKGAWSGTKMLGQFAFDQYTKE